MYINCTCILKSYFSSLPSFSASRFADLSICLSFLPNSPLIFLFNPLTPKIWLLILPSSCYTFPFELVRKIWFSIKVISFTWWVWVFSLPLCWIMYVQEPSIYQDIYVILFMVIDGVFDGVCLLKTTNCWGHGRHFWAVLSDCMYVKIVRKHKQYVSK